MQRMTSRDLFRSIEMRLRGEGAFQVQCYREEQVRDNPNIVQNVLQYLGDDPTHGM